MHIQVADVQAWLDPTKSPITSIDPAMEQFISGYTLGRLTDTFNSPVFGTVTWVDFNSTPLLVKQAMSMQYAAWVYDKQYSELVEQSNHVGASIQGGLPVVASTGYGLLLRSTAETLIEGIITGSIILTEIQPNAPAVLPEFYPNDISSTTDALENNSDPDDFSQGPVMFGVSKIF